MLPRTIHISLYLIKYQVKNSRGVIFTSAWIIVGRQCDSRSLNDTSKLLSFRELREEFKLQNRQQPKYCQLSRSLPQFIWSPTENSLVMCLMLVFQWQTSDFKLFIFLIIALLYRTIKIIKRANEECYMKKKKVIGF